MTCVKGVRGRVAENLSGQKFNRLTAICRDTSKAKRVYWNCSCECGAFVSVSACDLKSGHTKSCGCFNQEARIANNTTHGMSGTPTYISWLNMIDRCYDSTNKRFDSYGGRGICVCDAWRTFDGFFADMGVRPEGMTLERIDVDGNYDPFNCKWATHKEQANNWRKSIRAEYMGKSYTAKQLSELLGVNYGRVVWAIKRYGVSWHDYIVRAAAAIGKEMK